MKTLSVLLTPSGKTEFSRVLSLDDVRPAQRYSVDISPSDDERRALARRLNVDDIDSLRVQLNIDVLADMDLYIKGTLKAKVKQTCVISLRPVTSNVRVDVELTASQKVPVEDIQQALPEKDGEEELDISAGIMDYSAEGVERIDNGKIDLGEILTQLLALEINPYPRARNAAPPAGFQLAEPTAEPDRQRPFENLANLLKSGDK